MVREPEPIAADGRLIFPDFALQLRSNPARRWLLEIVGFWTPDYVARKLALYRSARLSNLILCIDEDRNCAEADLPPGALVVRFRRRVDAAAVLRLVGRNAYSLATMSRATESGRVTKGRVGAVHACARRPSGSFHKDHQPGSAGRNS